MINHVDREKIWKRLQMKEPIKPSINESIIILEELAEVEKQRDKLLALTKELEAERDKLAHALDDREEAIKILNLA